MLMAHALATSVKRLEEVAGSADAARQEALWLLMFVTKLSSAALFSGRATLMLSSEQLQALEALLVQREQGKPLQYLLGTVPFGNLTLRVREPIFIPRPETEEMVDWIARELAAYRFAPLRILDMCTGTGAIALGLAAQFPQAIVVGADINREAVGLAQENAQLNNLQNRVTFIESDLLSQLQGQQFDLVVSNPPYLAYDEWEALTQGSIRFEDMRAFVAQQEGMAVYRYLLEQVPSVLRINSPLAGVPQLVCEIGPAQEHIEELLADFIMWRGKVYVDLQGNRRWIALKFDKK